MRCKIARPRTQQGKTYSRLASALSQPIQLSPGESFSEQVKPWNVFMTLPPPDEDETLDASWVEVALKIAKVIAYLMTFLIIFAGATLSKLLVLLMTSMIQSQRNISICVDVAIANKENLDRDKQYAIVYDNKAPERIAFIWSLFFVLLAPELITFLASLWRCIFKNYLYPTWTTFLTVLQTIHFSCSLLYNVLLQLNRCWQSRRSTPSASRL